MSQSVKQDIIEKQSKLYEKLAVQVNKQIQVLREQKANATAKKMSAPTSQGQAIWMGMETAYSNALSELELANDRAHYNFK